MGEQPAARALLDDAGIDFMLPIARWIGYGGETNFHGSVLETMTWATGLLAKTRHITVFATMHMAANHPVVVAKQIATIDQISGGRIGLNIVAGWNKPEYEALGLALPADHATRYRYAQEWFDVVKKLWCRTESFDWDGELFQAEELLGDPRPADRAADHQRRRLGRGARLCHPQRRFPVHAGDRPRPFQGGDRRAQGAGAMRPDVDVLTFSHVVCRPTRAGGAATTRVFRPRMRIGRRSTISSAAIRPCAVVPA